MKLERLPIATCAKHDGRSEPSDADDAMERLAEAKDATSTTCACFALKGDHAHSLFDDMHMGHNRNRRNQNHLSETNDAIAPHGCRIFVRALTTLPNWNHHNKSQVSAVTRPQTMSGLFLLFCQT